MKFRMAYNFRCIYIFYAGDNILLLDNILDFY